MKKYKLNINLEFGSPKQERDMMVIIKVMKEALLEFEDRHKSNKIKYQEEWS